MNKAFMFVLYSLCYTHRGSAVSVVDGIWAVWCWLHADRRPPAVADWSQLQSQYGENDTSHGWTCRLRPWRHGQRSTYSCFTSASIVWLVMVTQTATVLLQPFYGPLPGTTWMRQYHKKHSPTPTYPDHHSYFISYLHLLWSIASSLFNLHVDSHFAQPFSKSSWSGTLHFMLCTFLHPIIIFFLQHMPIPSRCVLL